MDIHFHLNTEGNRWSLQTLFCEMTTTLKLLVTVAPLWFQGNFIIPENQSLQGKTVAKWKTISNEETEKIPIKLYLQ